jgi:hypothetical protein
MTGKRRRKKILNHYLITLPLDPGVHMHCYLMCDGGYDAAAAMGERMFAMAEERGIRIMMPVILSTKLDTGVEIVREFVRQMPEAERELETAKDYHCTVWFMMATDDKELMELH